MRFCRYIFALSIISAVPWGVHASGKVCTLSAAEKTLAHLGAKFDTKSKAPVTRSQVSDQVARLLGMLPNTQSPLPADDTHLADHEYLYRYVEYCAITYCDQDSAVGMTGVNVPRLLMGDFGIVYWTEISHLVYYIAVNVAQKSIVLAVRGTADTHNWLTDAESWWVTPEPTLYPGAPSGSKIHRGFQQGVVDLATHPTDGARARLESILDEYPGYDVIVTGHSLGGALAITTYVYLALNSAKLRPRLRAVYAYGQPICGNGAFVDYLSASVGSPLRYIRVVSSDDLVPWLNYNADKQKDEAKQLRHSRDVNEVYMREWNAYLVQTCSWDNRWQCSEGVACGKRSWDHHSWYGGHWAGKRFCLLSVVPQKKI